MKHSSPLGSHPVRYRNIKTAFQYNKVYRLQLWNINIITDWRKKLKEYPLENETRTLGDVLPPGLKSEMCLLLKEVLCIRSLYTRPYSPPPTEPYVHNPDCFIRFCTLFFFLVSFQDSVSLLIFGCSRTRSVDQAGLQLGDLPVSAF